MDECRDATQVQLFGSCGKVTSFKHSESVNKSIDFFSFEEYYFECRQKCGFMRCKRFGIFIRSFTGLCRNKL